MISRMQFLIAAMFPNGANEMLKTQESDLPTFEQALAYRMRDAIRLSGWSEAALYAAIADGTLKSWKVVGKRMIDPESLRKLVRGEA